MSDIACRTRIFFDVEFTDFESPQMISLGMVAEMGGEFYVEVDFNPNACSMFVEDQVLPMLTGDSLRKETAAERLTSFLDGFKGGYDLVCDYDLDAQLLRQLASPLLDGVRILVVAEDIDMNHETRHYALQDARTLCDWYKANSARICHFICL